MELKNLLSASTFISFKLSQKTNAESPMSANERPNFTEIKDLQLPKDRAPILVTASGIIKEVRAEQLLKAIAPIVVREFGSVIDVKALHPKKA